MLAAYARNMGFVPTHSEKCGFYPKYAFQLSSQKVCPSTQYLFGTHSSELDNTAYLLAVATTVPAATP
jgi:hypothetical protein